LQQLTAGRSLSELLAGATESVPARDLGLLKEFCFGTARWWLRLAPLAELLLKHPLKPRDGDLHALILLGLYQLEYMRVAPHAAVAETVEAARVLDKPWATGLVNGVLRRFLRERGALLTRVDRDLPARYAHPQWLIEALQKEWPDRWNVLLEAANHRPPMTLRINLARISQPDYFEQLRQAAVPARSIPGIPSAAVLEQPMDAIDLPGFAQGLVSVQDAGAQLAATLLDLQRGDQVLDVCAAPGGKSAHILESAPEGVTLTAVDIDAGRLARVRENIGRLGLTAEIQVGDATRPEGAWAERSYQRILLDVPCSATGVIRRHPDIKLLRKADDIPPLAARQSRILNAVWPLLKSGGMLLYATCSLLPEENSAQVKRFLAATEDAREKTINSTWGHACEFGRQILPSDDTMDGFYYACLQKA
jgi:16S rRNA (cytosine967-C5)-methyltransferase